MSAGPRCGVCGEPLGVYEPVVEVDGKQVRRTSRAAVPDLCRGDGVACYHAACFEHGPSAADS